MIVTLKSSLSEQYLIDNNIKVKSYNNMKDLISNINKDDIILVDMQNYEYYKNKDRGLYYEYSDVVGGTVAFNENELFEAIKDNLINPELEKAKREKLIKEYITYESSENSKKIVNRIKSECR